MLQQSRHKSHGLVPMPWEHYIVSLDLHAILLSHALTFISPSSILCIQQHHIMLLHPTHCDGTPIACHPIVCAAGRDL